MYMYCARQFSSNWFLLLQSDAAVPCDLVLPFYAKTVVMPITAVLLELSALASKRREAAMPNRTKAARSIRTHITAETK
jgi:hypothetical protein